MFDDGNKYPWLEGLNADQLSAATYSGDTLLILAGAGTGKTTTLCARVAWLLAKGVPAEALGSPSERRLGMRTTVMYVLGTVAKSWNPYRTLRAI
jgi:DNA helicase-2/ATP-dependent DNA helicase PcrA